MALAQHPRVRPPTLERALTQQPGALTMVLPETNLLEAAHQLAASPNAALAVVGDGGLRGVLSADDVVGHLARGKEVDQPVSAVMRAEFQRGESGDLVEDWLEKIGKAGRRTLLAVFSEDRLVGLLDRSDLLVQSDAYHRRVLEEGDLDHRIMHKQGTYSC